MAKQANMLTSSTVAATPQAEINANPAPARACGVKPPPPGAVVPRHGRGWLKPGKLGMASPNPSGVGGSAYHETMSIARSNAPEAMRRLVELSQSDDERIAFIAASAIIERAWGKAPPFDPTGHPAKSNFDLSRLSLADLRALMAVMEAARVPDEDAG
jgi:hypothetical protein